jgi:unsaturated rhamnogalacturonyl hydrolase
MLRIGSWSDRNHTSTVYGPGQTYLELYLLKKNLAMMAPTRAELDALLATPHVSKKAGKSIPWWWCDVLFMAPPVWARMYAATGDRKYIAYIDEEWAKTSDLLYDKQEHLYARDADYLTRTEANGKKMFWSRGNGWVMGGLVWTLQYLRRTIQRDEITNTVEGDGRARGFASRGGRTLAGRIARSEQLLAT